MNDAYQERLSNSYAIGKKAEADFEVAAEKIGFTIVRARGKQDSQEHWDRMIVKNPIAERVDVKAMRNVHPFGYTWVELQNVTGGTGWLYGEAFAIAFEKEDRFDLIQVVDLRKLIEENVNKTLPLLRGSPKLNDIDLLYWKYRIQWRWNRDDRVVLTPYEDINKLIYRTFFK